MRAKGRADSQGRRQKKQHGAAWLAGDIEARITETPQHNVTLGGGPHGDAWPQRRTNFMMGQTSLAITWNLARGSVLVWRG